MSRRWAFSDVHFALPAKGAFANGTSFAAPMFAAVKAEIDQRQGDEKGHHRGPSFHDITARNTGWQATEGYDAASGIGWPDAWSLSSVE